MEKILYKIERGSKGNIDCGKLIVEEKPKTYNIIKYFHVSHYTRVPKDNIGKITYDIGTSGKIYIIIDDKHKIIESINIIKKEAVKIQKNKIKEAESTISNIEKSTEYLLSKIKIIEE